MGLDNGNRSSSIARNSATAGGQVRPPQSGPLHGCGLSHGNCVPRQAEHCGNSPGSTRETVDLHLVIAAPEELQSTVGQAAHHISGAWYIFRYRARLAFSDKGAAVFGQAAEVTSGSGARQMQFRR